VLGSATPRFVVDAHDGLHQTWCGVVPSPFPLATSPWEEVVRNLDREVELARLIGWQLWLASIKISPERSTGLTSATESKDVLLAN
jgi:hypothetical protein